MDFNTVFETELATLRPICEHICEAGYDVWRSELFSNYYGGNLLVIRDVAGRTLAQWEACFRTYFPREPYVHTTFTLRDNPSCASLVREAASAGYHVARETYMVATDARLAQHALAAPFQVGQIESEEQWGQLQRFADAGSRDEDWYDASATDDPLFEMIRYVSGAINATWHYASDASGQKMLSKLGIFEHDGLCRLLDVATARDHRRKGLARALVSFAVRDAIETRGSSGLCLCADREDIAIGLYRSLGFVDVGDTVTLMKYPVRNPNGGARQ